MIWMWQYISIIPQYTLYGFSLQLGKLMILLLLVSFVIRLVLTYYITKKNYNQITNIINILNSAENNKELPPLPDPSKDEYNYIINNILKTFIESSYLRIALSEKKFKMKAMELMALQSQMNPHFIFNTLKTIYWKSFALTNGFNEVSEMIDNFSDIIQYTLTDPGKSITLETEIKNTESYINIQKIRYKDKFDVFWEYDKKVLGCSVIKLLFQPLIENSICHGIINKDGFGEIKIKIIHRESSIRISIIDNGIGIEKDKLMTIRKNLKDNSDNFEHIGLYNTNKRLKLSYGDEYEVKIRSKYGLGTAISITIPYIKA